MSQTNDSQQPVDTDVNELLQQESYGVTLREAREKAGLSIDDVAEKILISVDVLKALENSQSDGLPSVTFTQGYIRSYAKILELNADDVIKAYLQTVPDQNQGLSPKGLIATQKTAHSSFPVVMIIVVLFLVGLFYWLFDNNYKAEVDITKTDTAEVASHSMLEDENDFPDASLAVPVESTIDPGEIQPSETTADILEPVEIAGETVVIENAKQPENTVEAESIIAFETDSITITALADTWCELKDAEGKRLVYRLLNKGEELKLEGKAPFSIFLGVSSAAKVSVNGKLISYEHLIEEGKKTIMLEFSPGGKVKRINRS